MTDPLKVEGNNTPELGSLSETMVLAIASALVYVVAFSYRSGFSSHFGVPPVSMTPSLGRLLQATVVVGGVLAVLYCLVEVAWAFLPSPQTAVGRAGRRFFTIILLLSLLVFAVVEASKAWLTVLGIALFFLFVEFGLPNLTRREFEGLEKKLLEEERAPAVWESPLTARLTRVLGMSAIHLATLTVGVVAMASAVGVNVARSKEYFLVLKGIDNHVVVAFEDESLILAEFTPSTRTLTGNYRVHRLSDEKPWEIEHHRIGMLKSPPIPNEQPEPHVDTETNVSR